MKEEASSLAKTEDEGEGTEGLRKKKGRMCLREKEID